MPAKRKKDGTVHCIFLAYQFVTVGEIDPDVKLFISVGHSPNSRHLSICKQLFDEIFVISRIIEVEVGVISRSRRLRLITLTETSIILNITKTESNNCFIIH